MFRVYAKTIFQVFFSCLWRKILSARLLKYVHKLFRNPINSCFEMKLGWFGMGWAETAGLWITVCVCVWEIEGILWSLLMNLLWAVCEHDEGVLMVFPWSWLVHRELKRKRDILYVHLLSIMIYSYYRLSAVLDDNVGSICWTLIYYCILSLHEYLNILKQLHLCLPRSIKINTDVCFCVYAFCHNCRNIWRCLTWNILSIK